MSGGGDKTADCCREGTTDGGLMESLWRGDGGLPEAIGGVVEGCRRLLEG